MDSLCRAIVANCYSVTFLPQIYVQLEAEKNTRDKGTMKHHEFTLTNANISAPTDQDIPKYVLDIQIQIFHIHYIYPNNILGFQRRGTLSRLRIRWG